VAPVLDAPSGADLLDASLGLEVVNRALSWRAETATDVPTFDSWQITPAADEPFPLGLTEEQRAEWPHLKLYGERWGHFGAFASEEGRRWDWLWGRLDAAMTLSSHLLSDAGTEPNAAAQLKQRLVIAICTEELREQQGLSQARKACSASPKRRSGSRSATRQQTQLVRRWAPWPTLFPDRSCHDVGPPLSTQLSTPGRSGKSIAQPSEANRPRILLYRGLGLIAQTIARRKVARLLLPDASRRTRDRDRTNEGNA
jgi:hypothetical protein